jgi:predicted metal-dependent peptidase
VDQSGSVSDEWLSLAFGSLEALAKQVTFHVYPFDTQVVEKEYVVWRRGQKMNLKRVRCGGTDFKAASDHANKNKHRFDGYLILTDGECADPGPSGLKRGWVIVPDRKLMFKPSQRDFVIKMKHDAVATPTKAA